MNSIIQHYTRRFESYGVSPQAVQYRDAKSQSLRFQYLVQHIQSQSSVIDFGCGLADLYLYMRANGYRGRYSGVEIVPAFLEYCLEQYGHDLDVNFVSSIQETSDIRHDWALISGVFNNVEAGGMSFLTKSILDLWQHVDQGVCFNFLSSNVNYKETGLEYFDLGEIYNFLRQELNAYVSFQNDYALARHGFPFEVTVCARKKSINPLV